MAKLIKADNAGYARAVDVLRAGALVALPTDTVYGLAGLADNADAVSQIYVVKNRPRSKALSVVVFAPDQTRELAKISSLAQSLMDAFWPGALTLVLPAHKGDPTIALRCPDVPWTKAFLKLGFTAPLVLPSANISGEPAPVTAAQVMAGIGNKISLILDGGTCKAEKESTIIAVDGYKAKLLRVGALSPEQLAAFDIEMDLV